MRWIRGWASVAQSANSFVKRRTAILAACGSGLALACGFRAWRCERTPRTTLGSEEIKRVEQTLADCRLALYDKVGSDSTTLELAHAVMAGRMRGRAAWCAELARRSLAGPRASWLVRDGTTVHTRCDPRFGEAHPGQLIAYLAGALELPASEGGNLSGWKSILAGTISVTPLDRAELGHLIQAVVMLGPNEEWPTQSGQAVTLDKLIERLADSPPDASVCWGIHAAIAAVDALKAKSSGWSGGPGAEALVRAVVGPHAEGFSESSPAFRLDQAYASSPSDLASYVGHVLELLAACRGTRWLRVDRAHVDQAVADVIPRLGSAGAWSAAASSHLHRGLQLWRYEVP